METSEEAHGFVDFANEKIHIHSITPSATQEEILFSCCPEAFLAILVCDTLRSDEVVILRGCKRFFDYWGYGETFQFVGSYSNQNRAHIQDILVMDACLSAHFSRRNIDRDLGKAWAVFTKAGDETIVTGNWGCGVFCGDPILKFLQQVCAACVAGAVVQKLDYSVYGNGKLVSELRELMEQLEKNRKTVADVYQMMVTYGKNETGYFSRRPFSNYIHTWLNAE